VRKCRPWFWDLIADVRLMPMFELAQVARIKPITAELQPHILFPLSCQPLCDGIIEIYERECCCHHIHIPGLLDRLRDILDILPIPIPDPIPEPIRDPIPRPSVRDCCVQGPEGPAAQVACRSRRSPAREPVRGLPRAARDAGRCRAPLCHRAALSVSDLLSLLRAQGWPDADPARWPVRFLLFARASSPHHRYCYTTYAYRIKQLINGVLTVVYDGLAAHQYFGAGDRRISAPTIRKRACALMAGDPPPNDGVRS
jgi:hypothetical protein